MCSSKIHRQKSVKFILLMEILKNTTTINTAALLACNAIHRHVLLYFWSGLSGPQHVNNSSGNISLRTFKSKERPPHEISIWFLSPSLSRWGDNSLNSWGCFGSRRNIVHDHSNNILSPNFSACNIDHLQICPLVTSVQKLQRRM